RRSRRRRCSRPRRTTPPDGHGDAADPVGPAVASETVVSVRSAGSAIPVRVLARALRRELALGGGTHVEQVALDVLAVRLVAGDRAPALVVRGVRTRLARGAVVHVPLDVVVDVGR